MRRSLAASEGGAIEPGAPDAQAPSGQVTFEKRRPPAGGLLSPAPRNGGLHEAQTPVEQFPGILRRKLKRIDCLSAATAHECPLPVFLQWQADGRKGVVLFS